MKLSRLSIAALALTACTSELPHEAPFDSKAPLSKQARAQLVGKIRLENETDFSQVTVQLQNEERTYSVQTLPDGAVALTGVVPGRYALNIVTRYFQAVSETVEISLADTIDLGDRTLPAKRTSVRGSALIEDRNGNRIGGVSIKLSRAGSLRGGAAAAPAALKTAATAEVAPGTSFTTTSNFEGEFEVGGVPSGVYTVSYEKAGIASDEVSEVQVTGEDGVVTVNEIVLLPIFGFLDIAGINAANAVSTPTVTVNLTPTGSPAFIAQLAYDADFITAFPPFNMRPTTSVTLPGIGSDGLKTLFVRYFDATGNQSSVGSASVVLDTLPPQLANFTIAEGNLTNDPLINITYSALEAVSVRFNENSCGGSFEAYTGTKTFALFSPGVTPAAHSVNVQFVDHVGNASACLTKTIVLDRDVPVIGSVYAPAVTSSNIVGVNFGLTSGATRVIVSESPGFGDAQWQPYSANKTVVLSAGDGTKLLYIKFADDAGNETAFITKQIVVDSAPPVNPLVYAMTAVTSQTSVMLQISAGQVSEMLISENADFSGANWEPYAPLKNFSLTSADGVKTVYAKFRKASLVETSVATATVTLDRTAPILPSIRINSGAAVVNSPIATLNLSAVDATSGLYTYKVNTTNSFGAVPAKAYQSTDVFTLGGADGAKTLWVIFGDKAGNYSFPAAVTVTLDSTAPSLTGPVQLKKIDGTVLTNNQQVRDGRIILSSVASDITTLEMQISTTGSFSDIAWEPYSASKVIDLAGGATTLSARVRDAAGHIVDLLAGFTLNLDDQAPLLALTLTSPSPTRNRIVALDLSATEPSQAQVSENVGFSGADWFSTSATTLTLTAGDGIRTLFARVRDAAGNISELKSVTLALDETPPENAAFVILAGVQTNNRAIGLTYSGVEIAKVRVSEDTCSGAYVPHSGGGVFTIASLGDGVKTIRVQFSDAVGNESACLTKTILLDETAPVFGYVAINSDENYATQRIVSVGISVTGATEMQLSESATFTGAGWLPVTDSTTLTLSAGEGVKSVHARFRDTAGNTITGLSDDIVVDTLPPVFSALTGPVATNGVTVPLMLTASNADKMRLSENADFGGASWVTFNAIPTFTISNTQGQHTIYVQLQDNATNESISRSYNVTLDSAAPNTPVVSIVGGVYTKLAGITVQTIADGAAEIQISQDAGFSGATWMPYSQLKSFALVGGEAAHTIYVKVRDVAQNESGSSSVSITLDQTPPQVFMRAEDGQGNHLAQTNSTRYYMKLTVTDATPMLAQFNSLNSFSGVSSEAAASIRMWDVVAPTLAVGANYNTYVQVVDAAGNATVVGPVTVLVDTVGPSGATLALSPGLTSDTTVDVNLSASNADFVELSEDISFLAPTIIGYSATSTHTFSTGDGTKTLFARYVDALGNYSAIVAAGTTLDQTPPENPAFLITQASPTKQTSLDLTLSANGATQMAVSENACGTGWESYTQSKVFPLSTAAGLEVDKIIAVRFRDAVNNRTSCVTKTIRFDNLAPQIVSAFEVNYGAASTSSGVVTLNVQVTGADEMQVSENNSFTDAAWLPYSGVRTFTLSAGNGTKTVYARFRDNADNQTSTVSDSIVLDTTPISTPFVTIQADATSSTTVPVNLAASNIDEMWLSESPGFATGAWEPYFATKSVSFSGGDGVKTLYAKFRKTSGAESVVVSDTFLLDTTPPILPSIRVNNGAVVVSDAIVTLNLSAVDETSGLAVYRLNTANSFSAISDKGYQTNDVYTLSAGDGLKTLWVIFGDQARNYSAAASVAVLLDRAAPVLATVALQRLDGTPISSGATVKDGRVILATSVSDLTTLEMQVTTNGSYASLGWEPYNPGKVIDLTASSSTISARVRDAAGQVTDLLSGYIVNLDNDAPTATFTLTSSTPTNDLTVTYTVASSESGTMQVSADIGFAGASWEAIAAGNRILTSGDGVRSLYARTRDAAGNVSDVKTISIILDRTPPQNVDFTIVGGSITNRQTVDLTFSGVDVNQVSVAEDNCVASFVANTTNADSFDVSAGDGVKTIAVQFRDAAGNTTACYTKTITLDRTPPSLTAAKGVVINADAQYATNSFVTLALNVTGAAEMLLSNNPFFGGAQYMPITSATQWGLEPGDGTRNVYVRFRDQAQNVFDGVTDSIVVDTAAPTNTAVAINGGASYAVANSVTLTLSASDAQAITMQISNDGIFDTEPSEPFAASKPWTLNAGDGNKTVHVRFTDAAGNRSNTSTASIGVDTLGPVGTAISINSGASSVSNVLGNVTLSLSGFDGSGVAGMKLANLGVGTCAGVLSGASEEPFQTIKSWVLNDVGTDKEGMRFVCAMYRDGAGTWSTPVSDSIVYDTLFPTAGGAPIVINGGAQYSTSTQVQVALNASGATEMKLGTDAGLSGANWESFNSNRSWTFASGGDGVDRTLYVKYRDSVGNETNVYSDSITLDTVAPASLSMLLDGGAEYVSAEPNYTRDVTFEVTVGASSWAVVEISDDVGFQNMLTTATPVTVFPVAVSFATTNRLDGAKTIYARFFDGAGNGSPIISRTINLDMAKPSPVSIVVNAGSVSTSAPDGVVNLTMSAGDSGSGIEKMRLSNSLAALPAASEEPYNGNKLWALSASGANQEGMRWVWFQVADRAGNYSEPVSDTIAYDTRAPQFVAFNVLTPEPSPLRTAELQLAVLGATEMILGHDIGFTNRSWEPYNEFRGWTFNAGGNGTTHTVYAKFRDAAGNTTVTEYTATFVIDDVAPQNPVISVTGGAEQAIVSEYSRDLEFQVAGLSASGGWERAEVASDVGFTNIRKTVYALDVLPVSASFLSAIDGSVPVYVRFIDAVGNVSVTASDAFTLDRVGPTITRVYVDGYDVTNPGSAAPVTTASGIVSVGIEASDIGGGVHEVELTEGQGGMLVKTAFLPQPKNLQLLNLGTQGLRSLLANVTDKAGNVASWSSASAIDYRTSVVTGWNMHLQDKFGSLSFTAERDIFVHVNPTRILKKYMFSENSTFAGATWKTPALETLAPQNIAYSLTSGGNGVSKTVWAKFIDQYGLVSSTKFDDIPIDDTPPVTPAPVIQPSYYVGSNQLISFTYTFGDFGDIIRVARDPQMTLGVQEFAWNGFQPFSYTISSGGAGPRVLYFRAKDGAGNWSEVYAWDYFSDLVLPTINSLQLNGGATNTNSLDMTLTLTAQDGIPGSGLDRVYISPDLSCSPINPQTLSRPYANTVSFTHWSATQGAKSVYVCVVDAAGNISLSQTRSITYDSVVPSNNTLAVNDGDGIVNSPSVSLTATSVDGGIEVQIANEPTFAGAVWQPTGASIQWVLTNGDGTKTVYARFRDAAGNVSTNKLLNIELDTASPNPPALQIIDIDADGVAIYPAKVELRWTYPASTLQYEMQRIVLGVDSDFRLILTPGAATTEYADVITNPGYKHQYRIRAVDGSGNYSDWSLPVEARPFNPVTEVTWIRSNDQLRFDLIPPTGAFSIEPQYAYADINGAVTTTQLTDNVLSWTRPTPGATQYSEQLIVRGANQDQSLVNESTFKLPFASYSSPEDSCYSEGATPSIDSVGDSIYVTARRDCAISVWKWTTGVWTRWQVDTASALYGIDHQTAQDGTVHIAYNHNAAGVQELRYAVGSGSTWTVETIQTSAISEYGMYPSITLDHKGVPHILSYRRNTGSAIYELYWSHRTGGTWTTTVLATFVNSNQVYPAIVSDQLGRLHAAYAIPGTGIVYRRYENGAWSGTTLLRAGGFTQSYPSIAVDRAGTVHISYEVIGNGVLYYHDTSGSFAEELIAATAWNQGQNNIAIAADGTPHVSYYVSTVGTYLARRVAGSWQSTLVTNEVSYEPAITLHDGEPVVAYSASDDSTIRLAWVKDNSWRPWTEKTIYGAVAYTVEMDFDADGYMHVAYTPNACRGPRVMSTRPLRDDFDATSSILPYKWPVRTGTPTLLAPGIAIPSGTNVLNLDGGTDSVESPILPSTLHAVRFDWAPTLLGGGAPETGDNLYLDWFNGSIWTNSLTLTYNGTPQNTFARAGARIPSTATKIRLRSNGVDNSDNYMIDNFRMQRVDGVWNDELIADCTGVQHGLRLDLEVAPNGARYSTHFDFTNWQLKYSTDETGVWVTTVLDDAGDGPGGLQAGENHALVLDSNGKAHVAYNRKIGTYYYLMYATNASGAWQYTQVSTNDGGEWNMHIAIDANDKAHISYRNAWSGPKYASNASGSWLIETPPGGGDAIWRTNLAVDAAGVVHMVWDNSSSAPDSVMYARREINGVWTGETIDNLSESRYPKIALGKDGLARVVYTRADQLGYAVRDLSGTWRRTTLSSANPMGNFDFEVAPNGKIALVYSGVSDVKLITGQIDGTLSPSSTRIPPPFQ